MLYLVNPALLQPLYLQFEKDPQVQKELSKAKDELKASRLQQHTLIRNIWHRAQKELLRSSTKKR